MVQSFSILAAFLLAGFARAEPQAPTPVASPEAQPAATQSPRPNDGPLPRGEPAVESAPFARATNTCPWRFTTIPVGEAFFSKQAGKFYVLAKVMTGNRHNLIEVDPVQHNGKSLASMTLKRSSLLLPHGDPPQGVSILTFFEEWESCGRGKALAITLDLGQEKSVRKTAPLKTYQLLGSDRGPVLGDTATMTLWEIDPRSGQRRVAGRLPEKERGVFLGPAAGKLWTFKDEGEGVLIRYGLDPLKKEGELRLKKDSFLVQEGSLFAALMLEPGGKEAKIQRFEKWSGERAASDRFTLPADFDLSQARFASHFSSGLLVAYNREPLHGRAWQNAYLIDYNLNKILATLEVLKDQYISEVTVAPDGQTAIFIIKRQIDQIVSSIQVWERASGGFKPIHMMLKP